MRDVDGDKERLNVKKTHKMRPILVSRIMLEISYTHDAADTNRTAARAPPRRLVQRQDRTKYIFGLIKSQKGVLLLILYTVGKVAHIVFFVTLDTISVILVIILVIGHYLGHYFGHFARCQRLFYCQYQVLMILQSIASLFIRLSLGMGRRLVNLLPVAQRSNALANGDDGRTWVFGRECFVLLRIYV